MCGKPGAQIGFAGARVIEETIREKTARRISSALEYLRITASSISWSRAWILPEELSKIIGLPARSSRKQVAAYRCLQRWPPLIRRHGRTCTTIHEFACRAAIAGNSWMVGPSPDHDVRCGRRS
jgi:hypothetical protein